uniref:Ribosomal protein S23 mitochondrial conserved domain-containing protein n=1 Tax=Panagrolaimus sp. ES5 TaxID=591445 RepID=A0AC34FKT3_9BILA
MASKRAAPVFSQITGLIRSGQMNCGDRPLWYDLYAVVPASKEPIRHFQMQKADEYVRSVMYKNVMIKARSYSEFRNSGGENPTKPTLCEQFIQQVEDERKANPKMTEEELFERAINVLNERGILKKCFGVSFCRFTDDRNKEMLERIKKMIEEIKEMLEQYRNVEKCSKKSDFGITVLEIRQCFLYFLLK